MCCVMGEVLCDGRVCCVMEGVSVLCDGRGVV